MTMNRTCQTKGGYMIYLNTGIPYSYRLTPNMFIRRTMNEQLTHNLHKKCYIQDYHLLIGYKLTERCHLSYP